jgi:nucleotide-binding universal stress UspA family protein
LIADGSNVDARRHGDITDDQLERMKKLMGVNCLHRGNIESVRGKRWMVAVDGSEASKRAFDGVLKLMDPADDHLLVVTVRDKNLPRRFALSPAEETQLRFELWKAARHIVKPYLDELSTRLVRSPHRLELNSHHHQL